MGTFKILNVVDDASEDDEDSSSYAMGGPEGIQGFHQQEEEDSE